MLKLIRDGLADLDWPVEPQLKKYVRPVHGRIEHRRLLVAKLFEELAEVINADGRVLLVAELADLHEATRCYALLHGIAWDEVREFGDHKRAERGGFEHGTVWEF